MASRIKILKQVDRLAQRGNPAEAAKKLLQLVEENPRDVNLLNKAGDLYVRAGLTDDAVKQFDTIATFFKQDGFLLKAIAIYKKISKLDPARIETFLQLGELYSERGLRMEAKQNLLHAAEAFKSRKNSGGARRALELLEKLDPDDADVHGKLVDLLEEGGVAGEASSRHLDAARKQLGGGKEEEGRASLEKALKSGSKDPALLRGMAELLLKSGDAARAADLLDKALPGIPEPDVEYLLLLGQARRDSGDLDGAKTNLEEALKLDYGNDCCHVEMALCHLAASDNERAFDQCRHVFNRPVEAKSPELCHGFLQQFLEAEPQHLHALRELAILHRDGGDDESYHQTLSRLAGACHQVGRFREELQILSHLVQWASGDVATVLDTRRVEAEQQADGQTEELDETLVDFLPEEPESPPGDEPAEEKPEVDLVFDEPASMSTNGTDRVVLGVDDEELPGGETEIELIIEDETLPEPVEEAPPVAEPEPEPEPELELKPEPEPELDTESPAVEPDAEEEAVEVESDVAAPAGESDIRERLTATRVFLSYGMVNKALGQVEELLELHPHREDVCELAASIYKAQGRDDDVEAMRARIAELTTSPGETPAPAPQADESARASWMNGSATAAAEVEEPKAPATEETAEVEPEPPAAVEKEEPAVEEPAPAPVAADAGGEGAADPLGEDLEEVDFFISQGFIAEARDLIQGLLESNPDYPRLLEMQAQVGGPGDSISATVRTAVRRKPAAPPVPPRKKAAASTEEPELTGTKLDDDQLSEVLTMFQEEVAGQVDDEDHGTHYDLGIAYKEMSLVDEAIGEFQIAARSTEKRLDCCVMLGACFMEKGMPGEAIKWYEKGLAVADDGSDENKGLQYDLAAALEADGSSDNALQAFQALAALDNKYRDVAARVKRLQSN